MMAVRRGRPIVPALLVVGALGLAVIGCGADAADLTSGSAADVTGSEVHEPDATAMTVRAADDGSAVLFDDGDTLHVVDPATGAERYAAAGGRASGDGAVVVDAASADGQTTVRARSAVDGTTRWITAVDGSLEVSGVSRKGETVALTDSGAPAGTTSFVIVRFAIPVEAAGYGLPADVTDPLPSSRRYDVEGELEFDAFSTATSTMFVLHRSAVDPDAYKVRGLDLIDGALYDMSNRDKIIPEGEMYGRYRALVEVPSRDEVATLYTVGESGSGAAFVHLLNLAGWADCLDLPAPLGRGEPSTLAIAAPGVGTPLHVFDSHAGQLALLNPNELGAVTVVSLADPALAAGHPAAIALGPSILLAAGDEVISVDATGATLTRWSVGGRVTGLSSIPQSTTVAAIVDGEVQLFVSDGKGGVVRLGREAVEPGDPAPPTSPPVASTKPPSSIATPSVSVSTYVPPTDPTSGSSVPAGTGSSGTSVPARSAPTDHDAGG